MTSITERLESVRADHLEEVIGRAQACAHVAMNLMVQANMARALKQFESAAQLCEQAAMVLRRAEAAKVDADRLAVEVEQADRLW